MYCLQPVGCLFVVCFFLILLILPFAEQIYIFLILVKSSLSIISFTVMPLQLCLKSHCHSQGHLVFLLFYFLRFCSSVFYSWSMIHFELICSESKDCIQIYFWQVNFHLCFHLLKNCAPLYCFCSFVHTISWPYLWGSISGFSILFL